MSRLIKLINKTHKYYLKTAAAKDRNFKNHTKNQQEEDAYDCVKFREGVHPTSVLGTIAHLIKGALGAGILSGHVAYMKGGVMFSIPANVICGCYMYQCLYMLVHSCQILIKRTRQPFLSYADCSEAAMMLFPKPSVAKYAKYFRYAIDVIICIDLFGACCCYQLVIAKSIKQLVENEIETTIAGKKGYPDLRVYVAIMIPPLILICLVRHLKYLAPFSIAANVVVAFSILMSIYYCLAFNPSFSGLTLLTNFEGVFQYVGMQVFSMSCSGIVIAVEGNMAEPHKFSYALAVGYVFIITATFLTSFFGYAAFLEKSTAPITINFPMTTVAMLFKISIAMMIYVTHALNFWVPFNLTWFYIKPRHNQNKLVMWERIYRAVYVAIIGGITIVFPDINALMGFIGSFCLSNMTFIWPNIIFLLVHYERPGYGPYKWKLWRSVVFLIVAVFVLFCGSWVNGNELLGVFMGTGGEDYYKAQANKEKETAAEI